MNLEPANLHVVSRAYGDLKTLYCKISGIAQLFVDRGDVGSVALNSEDGNYGIGLILEEIGSDVKAVGDVLEELTLAWAQKRKVPMAWRVLAVDDDLTIRLTMKSLFDSFGWPVVTVESVEDALAALSKEEFDVVISDVQMPNADGPELIRLMAERGIKTPVILMSGNSKYDSGWAAARGAQGYLEKPFGPDEVKSIIKETLSIVIERE